MSIAPDERRARQSRRRFLTRTLATTGVLALSARSMRAAEGGRPLDVQAIAGLRARLRGSLLVPADSSFDAARRVYFWNPETERRPALIVRCADADDVRRAVEFARAQALEIAVRGGGHSPMGWGISDGLVIDVRAMNGVAVDPATRTVRIGAGASSGEVMLAAAAHGLAPVLGQCPAVGAAGVTLGGGLGWLSGLHGASCDNLLGARVVTADGRLLSPGPETLAELLWGLGGAGANFGVTTSLDCRLHPLDAVTAGEIRYPASSAGSVLRSFTALMAGAPDAFQATLNLTPGERGVWINLCHAGEPADADRLLRDMRAVAPPTSDTVGRRPFAALAANAPAGATGVAFRGLATAYRDRLTDEIIDRILDRLAEAPAEAIIGVTHYMHGAVCRVAPEATAFPLRASGGVHFRVGMDWNDPASSPRLMRWARDTIRRLPGSTGARIYANYQSDAPAGSSAAVYGGNLARLARLKRTYDPDNVFRRNSNLDPAPA